MGYMLHHAIIITGTNIDHLGIVRTFAINKGNHCSETVKGTINDQFSFFVAPDGSKEGWNESDEADLSRKYLKDFLDNNLNLYVNAIEIQFAGDNHDDDKITWVIKKRD